MKNVHLVFSIVIFLALVCSPALAISKSDLISYYKGQSASVTPTQSVTPQTPTWAINQTPAPNVPKPIPTQVPLVTGTGTLSVRSTPSGAPVFIDGVNKGVTPVIITGVSVGVHQVSVILKGNEDHSTWVKILPRNWGVVTVDVTQHGETVGFAILEGDVRLP
jgi:hypothetical protein